ncbi:hypothetical protein KQ939_16250 [Planococcus sp. CP5-4]|uniref:TIGR04104 family putative zinc finger protein n=1 Tax=unclassified Planococcus (in: firmicutes) TaxID=2662419 RepID=UPI001C216B4D|nr:hypothetical protein [Planococcus sp. CP5-4_YE]MBV0909745.1 hypothetical protein [Planococcus sp. CP5-4_UN]MBW6065229.1 hypothetical protein [Planococcus sp. CP5-4]
MPHCQNCGVKWRWNDMIKIAFKGNIPCANCRKDQYVKSGRNLFWAFLLVIPFVLLFSHLTSTFGFSWPLAITAFAFIMTLSTLMGPFFYRLSNTKKRI